MQKRVIMTFLVMLSVATLLSFRILTVTDESKLAQAAQNQSNYRLQTQAVRGTIYDCNRKPITNVQQENYAFIAPTAQVLSVLETQNGEDAKLFDRLSAGRPVLQKMDNTPQAEDGCYSFLLPKHYEDNPLAVHVIGYLDGSGEHGVSGIEAAYDDWLYDENCRVTAKYRADAMGKLLSGSSIEINDAVTNNKKGVVLTIDREIQQAVESISADKIETGAVIVLEIPTGKIRAMVSLPAFDPENPAAYLEDENAPFMNRALSAYNVGSIFKLVTAACAIEEKQQMDYLCSGTIEFANSTYQCINQNAHGQTDLCRAVAMSCNCYFIRLSQELSGRTLLQKAQSLGFGAETTLAPGMKGAPGMLPAEDVLLIPSELANFSFGQGRLLATPLQIAALMNAIASDGCYTQPLLVEALLDEQGEVTQQYQIGESVRAMSASTAEQIKQFMVEAVENGTAYTAKPALWGAGAKTATAETGWEKDGHTVIQAWCAGFCSADDPKYAVVVLAEDGQTGSGTCGPVFREICDALYEIEQKREWLN